MTTSYVDIVFDGPPSHESGRFIEVENDKGASINFGEWVHRPDGFWALRIGAPISGERVREACAKDCDEAAAIWRGLNPKDFPFAAIRKEECEARAKSIRALPLAAIKGEQE